MAQTNANSEPTMEEILASIRRIIESNDEAAERSSSHNHEIEDTGSVAAHQGGEPPAELQTSSIESGKTGAAGPQPTAAPQPVWSEKETDDRRPVSLADVAARVRASGSASAPAATGAKSAAPVFHSRGSAAVRAEPAFEEAESWEETTNPDDSADESFAAVAANDFGAARKSAAGPEAEYAGETTAVGDDVDMHIRAALRAAVAEETGSANNGSDDNPEGAQSVVEGQEHREEAPPAAGRNLMSASTDAKVAAAFDDLSDAFAGGPRRSFDDIAEEMLRPMLHQWLDDNLPTLVERLVREEIERVARGGGR